MAAANRVRNLAKGLTLNQCVVEYIGLRGADILSSEDLNPKGLCDGIKYFYPGGFSARPNNWWMRRVDDLCGTCLSIIHILHKKFTNKLDAVIIYSSKSHIVIFWCRFLHLLHIPVLLEVCEWPLARAQTFKHGFSEANKFSYNAIPKVDAVLPISTYIDNEISKIAKKKKKKIPSFLIPILIDITPNNLPTPHKRFEPYLLYSGAIAYFDNAKIVVDTLYELKCRGFNLPVKFTGGGEKKLIEQLKQYADEKGVLQQLKFTGFVEEYELYRLMLEAKALLAPLPEDLRTAAKFPTKLGYYLVSGSPVVTNSVGDVGLYLQDGVNAFVAQECNPVELSDKIEQIINNPTYAEEVGRNGQKLALDKFHYTTACKGLYEFLQKIITSSI
ncbi:MAG: hypothetical protein AMJ61_05220 [Desulfobacterales bacterium SG8_35_2]|nr:MAG: hypothetical protein AMJ61_05220 [Desulfobacterales bacterium SG8_35_2]